MKAKETTKEKETTKDIDSIVALARAAAVEAAKYQERFAAEDVEARKIVDIMENYLRLSGRVVYGGAAINAHMPPQKRFYDPRVYLPDYDFLTPDPIQDCADLIAEFHAEGFQEVEAKFGIHEGTYKVFVNFRAAADITYMPDDLYERIVEDSSSVDGIRYASPNFLRMNMYLELSRPAGMVSRWEKVYQRLLLLNETHPLRAGRCPVSSLESLTKKVAAPDRQVLHASIVDAGIQHGVIFLSGANLLMESSTLPSDEIVLMMTDKPALFAKELTGLHLKMTLHEAQGELLPSYSEFHTQSGIFVAVVFETVACHSYSTLEQPKGYRLGSLDLLIQMYYALYFAKKDTYFPVRILCLIQELIDMESAARAKPDAEPEDVFQLDCLGHQATMPELKRAHRQRVQEKQAEVVAALHISPVMKGKGNGKGNGKGSAKKKGGRISTPQQVLHS